MEKLENLPNTGLLRDHQFLHFMGISRSTFWAMVKAGKFPRPIKLSSRVSVWRAEDIQAWIVAAAQKPDSSKLTAENPPFLGNIPLAEKDSSACVLAEKMERRKKVTDPLAGSHPCHPVKFLKEK